MNPDKSLQASLWLMVVLQTIGSVDLPVTNGNNPTATPRKLPAPRQYVAIVIVWSVLQLVNDAGGGRAAAIFGWVVVLAGAVLGPFGKTFTNLLTSASQNFAPVNGTTGDASLQTGGTPQTNA